MEYQELLNKYKMLEEENKLLKDELVKTKEHLKKYTAPI
jgi:cell shape-determining protein MreC